MRRLARRNGLLDPRQHGPVEDVPRLPMVHEQMLTDALDAHGCLSLPASRGAATPETAAAAGKPAAAEAATASRVTPAGPADRARADEWRKAAEHQGEKEHD